MRRAADYRDAARGFAAGTEQGLTEWLLLSCRALQAGAREALSIADSKDQAGEEITVAHVKRAAIRIASARRPLARISGYQACECGLRGLASAVLRCASAATPPKGSSMPFAFRNYAGPQHFCHYRGCGSAWVPGSVLGSPVREIEPSLPSRPWPHQASVLPLYSVTPVTARAKFGMLTATPDRYCLPAPAQNANRRNNEYVNAPAASALIPTAAVVATAAPDGRRDPVAQRHRPGERQHRPAPRRGLLAQGAVGVDRGWMADGLQHRQVGDRIRVGVAVFERVALAGGQFADRLRLAFAVAVERHLAGVLAVLDDHPGRHRVGGAQCAGDRGDDLLARRRDHHDVAAAAACGRRSVRRLRQTPAGRRCRAASRRRST